MAKGKGSFILYCDIIATVSKLPNDKAGELFKIILEYVNDNDPQVDDLLIQVAFEPIKQSLKRDLKRWESYVEKQSFNGKKGGRPKTQKTQAFSEKPKKADSVSVSVSVSEEDKKKIDKKKKVFSKPGLDDIVQYFLNQEMPESEANSFHDYYEANGWKVGRNPMKNWQAAARNWKKNYKGYGRTAKMGTSEARLAAIKNF